MSNLIKEKAIIFSTKMIQAILEGRKTQTRRIFKEHYGIPSPPDLEKINKYSKYKTQDILYVKETYDLDYDGGNELIAFYKADYSLDELENMNKIIKWKNPLYMPKKYSRIKLKIKGLGVQQLQDISESDVLKEGVESIKNYSMLWDSIHNKKDSLKWKDNPWVFVYDFEKI